MLSVVAFAVSLQAWAHRATIVGVVHAFGDSVGRMRDVDVSLDPTGRSVRTAMATMTIAGKRVDYPVRHGETSRVNARRSLSDLLGAITMTNIVR